MADPWVRPSPPGLPDPGVSPRPEDEVRTSLEKNPSADDYLLIDRLREDAVSGRMDLSSILSEATHAARYFTDATGAALALWSQGVVICRARSGDTAPPLGAKLEVDSGVSGECLRTGRSQRCTDTLTDPRVDGAVCQEMGIRSLAAVPMRGGQGVIGILEVFSDRPNAFSDAHITLLKKLAKIAATGREKSVAPFVPLLKESTPPTEKPASLVRLVTLLRRPEQFNFLPARMRGEEGQPLRLAAAAVLLLILGISGWIVTRARSGSRPGQSVHAASVEAVPPLMAASASANSGRAVSAVDAGSAGNASNITLGGNRKPSADLMARDVVQKASTSVVVTDRHPTRPSDATPDEAPAPVTTASVNTKNTDLDVPAPDVSAAMQNETQTVPQSVANPRPIFPFVAVPVSQGVSGGRLSRKVEPIYPAEARLQRIEGSVVLDALVGEDGNVRDVQVTSGPPLLVNAAKQAVKRWRYEPFLLNGKPLALHTQITIQFKLP
jgi:TonB family protein